MKKLSQFTLQTHIVTSFLVLWQLVIAAVSNYLVPTPVQVAFALVKVFSFLRLTRGLRFVLVGRNH